MFKKKGRSSDHFRFPDGNQFTVDQPNSSVKLPKLGWISYRNSRKILGTAKNITISSIGIDVGIARFATFSDGRFIAPLNSLKQHQERLARYQRRMSRKIKYSNNWKKAKAKIQKIHTRMAHAQKDFLHKTPTTIPSTTLSTSQHESGKITVAIWLKQFVCNVLDN